MEGYGYTHILTITKYSAEFNSIAAILGGNLLFTNLDRTTVRRTFLWASNVVEKLRQQQIDNLAFESTTARLMCDRYGSDGGSGSAVLCVRSLVTSLSCLPSCQSLNGKCIIEI